jgi:DNA mismatch endonuclease Vsr
MPDQFSPAERSRIMRCVKSGDTTPELVVRRLVHGLGYRFRLNNRGLPGSPDLVLPRLGKAIFVHGASGTVMRAGQGSRRRRRGWTTGRRSSTAMWRVIGATSASSAGWGGAC